MGDTLSVTPMEKTDFPSPSGVQLQTASWLGVVRALCPRLTLLTGILSV